MIDPALLLHEERFQVRISDVGVGFLATPWALAAMLEEAAANHADVLGFGYQAMANRGLAWILSQLEVRYLRYPEHGAHLVLRTWPSGRDRLRAFRDFEIMEGDECLVRGVSAWIMLDIGARRPGPVNELLEAFDSSHLGRSFEPTFKFRNPEGEPELEYSFRARRSDVDVMRHVNNVRYLEWIVSSVPDSTWESSLLRSVSIDFRRESLEGDEVQLALWPIEGSDGLEYVHQVSKQGERLARGLTAWESR